MEYKCLKNSWYAHRGRRCVIELSGRPLMIQGPESRNKTRVMCLRPVLPGEGMTRVTRHYPAFARQYVTRVSPAFGLEGAWPPPVSKGKCRYVTC
eukprot:666141-Amorphochlora_amoeboformis.AAC.1